MALKRVFVTGGNAGIGLALCKQLAEENGCHVYLGSRSLERGEAAVKSIIEAAPKCEGKIELVQVDTASDASVAAAAEAVKAKLGSELLYGVVNNAGAGLSHGVTSEAVLNTNVQGPKRVCEAFVPLLDPKGGRVVNVGSGLGAVFVSKCSEDKKKLLSSPSTTWDQLQALVAEESASPDLNAYGLSKACLTVYTMILAREHPELKVNCITPGFIDTAMTAGFGASKPPEEGTVAIRHCLFAELEGNGRFYGSDALRSPVDRPRNPGEPAYTGE